MKKTKKKPSIWKDPLVQFIALVVIIVCCIIGYFIYNMPAFWVRPATVELLPDEGKGLYLGMSVTELKAIKNKLSVYKDGKLFVNEIYYDRKIGGTHFDNGHYTFSHYGRLMNIGFSRHMKAEVMDKEKYEYIKYFIAKYGEDYKKAIWVYKPYANKRFIYNMLVWEKKDARIVLEFSFYDNDRDGYFCKNRGIYLSVNYPKVTGESLQNKIIDSKENAELRETFRRHFPDLDKKAGELKKPVEVKKTVTPAALPVKKPVEPVTAPGKTR